MRRRGHVPLIHLSQPTSDNAPLFDIECQWPSDTAQGVTPGCGVMPGPVFFAERARAFPLPMTMHDLIDPLSDALAVRLFTLAGAPFTLGHFLAALAALFALLVVTRRLRGWLRTRLIHYGRVDTSTVETISALTQYVLLTLGFLTILNEVGLKLSSLTVLAGSFG